MKKAIKSHETEAMIFKALGHPTRLFIVHQLGKKEHCVCELTALVGDDISTVSKHLSVLKNAGIIYSIRKGNQIIYRLKLRCILDIGICAKGRKGELI